jgi:hypothetical protein
MMTTAKLDLKKEFPGYYRATKRPETVDLPAARFITYSGRGEPGGEAFQAALGALYSVAYTLKFTCKYANNDFAVPALEAFWWVDDASRVATDPSAILDIPKGEWSWKAMIRMPDFVTDDMLAEAQRRVKEKKGLDTVFNVKIETLTEGLCVQALHTGPYADEPRTIEEMRRFMEDNGLKHATRPGIGPHHEIYLSDPGRTAPEKLRTIIRIPVER